MDEHADEPPGLARIGLEEDEERSLGRLAAALRLVGMFQIIAAGLVLLFTIVGLFGAFGRLFTLGAARLIVMAMGMAYVALPIWQGVMLREAGDAIARVGGADMEDQDFLASAFRRLRVVFVIELLLALWHLYDELG